MSVLDRIVATERAALERSRHRLPDATLAKLAESAPPTRDFAAALRRGTAPRIIAEVKRASPSRGVLRADDAVGDWDPEGLAAAYEGGGAAALSVLTNVQWFWGHPDHLGACRERVALPALRKEFLLDPYQVDESRWLGADAVLLIAGILEPEVLQRCAARALELSMTALIEVHAEVELEAAMAVDHAVIGINHRDLHSFSMDMDRALRLREQIPTDRVVVAESGLESRADVERLMAGGIEAFLIGGHLAAADDPESVLRGLVGG